MDELEPGTRWQRGWFSESKRWGVNITVVQTTRGPEVVKVSVAPALPGDAGESEAAMEAAKAEHREAGGLTAEEIRSMPWEDLIDSTLKQEPPRGNLLYRPGLANPPTF